MENNVVFPVHDSSLAQLKDKNQPFRQLTLLALSFVLARSALSGWMNQIEARFSVTQMPIVEMATVLVLSQTILAWKIINNLYVLTAAFNKIKLSS